MVFRSKKLGDIRQYRFSVVFHDFLIGALAFIISFLFRYGFQDIGAEQIIIMQYGAPIFGLLIVVLSMVFGLNRHLWRYTTADDLVKIISIVTVATTVVFLALFLVSRLNGVPRSVPMILGTLTLLMLAGPRFLRRMATTPNFLMRSRSNVDLIQLPVLLVGLGPKTEMFMRWAKRTSFVPHRPVGILDIDGKNLGRTLFGVPIVGPGNQLDEILNWLGEIDQKPAWMIICDPVDVEVMSELTRIARQHAVKVADMPSLVALTDADAAKSIDLKPIAIEDLLGRTQIKLDLEPLRELIAGRRVMVTGGGGTIGGELCGQILRYRPSELCVLDSCEYNLYAIEQTLATDRPVGTKIIPMLIDIRDRAALDHHFGIHRPELVFHAAALKHVPLVEANPIEAIKTNVFGTKNVADAAKRHRALAMVAVSTDKAVNPTNVMGATKWLAEQYCQTQDLLAETESQSTTRFIVVRFGNVLGSSGSVVPLFKKQLAAGGPLTVTHPDITRYFMTVSEAVQLVLQAAAHIVDDGTYHGNVLVLDMGKPVKVYEMACHMARLAGLEPGKDIEIKYVGLRPGEKLFEELFTTTETRLPARIAGVDVASCEPPKRARVEHTLRRLEAVVTTHDHVKAVTAIDELVPGFQANADSRKVAAA